MLSRLRSCGALSAVLALWIMVPGGAQAFSVIVTGKGPHIAGSGDLVEQARALTGFDGLVVNGPVDVELKAGVAEAVVVRADDNIAPLIETRVEGGKLLVGLTSHASFRTSNKVQVAVTFKEMKSISIRGSGDVHADRIKTPIFEVNVHGSGDVDIDHLEADAAALVIAGSGDVVLRGQASNVGIVIEGSGDVNCEDLPAKDVAVRVRGSGDTKVNATESLQADVAGSGDVLYKGAPRVSKRTSGSGEVRPLR
jgi:hypothetical protein